MQKYQTNSIHSFDYVKFYSTLQYINSNKFRVETMASTETSTLTFRIEPKLKKALRTAAEQEHRSITNMVSVLIRDYCDKHKITIQKP